MKGMTLFEAMNDLPDDMLLEAAIPAGERRAHRRDRRDSRDSMTRISGSLYVALAVGFLAAICLLSFIIIAGRPASDPSSSHTATGEGESPSEAISGETMTAEEQDTPPRTIVSSPSAYTPAIILDGQAHYDLTVIPRKSDMYDDLHRTWVNTEYASTAEQLPEYADTMITYWMTTTSSLRGSMQLPSRTTLLSVTVYDADFNEYATSAGDFSCLKNLPVGTWYIAASTVRSGREIGDTYEQFYDDYVIRLCIFRYQLPPPESTEMTIYLGGQVIDDPVTIALWDHVWNSQFGGVEYEETHADTEEKLPEIADTMPTYQLSSSSLTGKMQMPYGMELCSVAIYDEDFHRFAVSYDDFSSLAHMTPGTWYIAINTVMKESKNNETWEYGRDYVIKVVVVE